MSSKQEQERQMLREAGISGPGAKLKAYTKLSGPGWLQSAITLGGGSLTASLFLGVLAGYSLLWLQPLAMILGIIMLCAISHVALSTGQSPFKAINEEINPVLGWGWAIATVMANIVWCLPQFALGTAAATQNLVPSLNNFWGKTLVCALLLGFAIAAILAYDRGAKGAKTFDRVLKIMVALIVIAFFGVVVKMSFFVDPNDKLNWSEIGEGFVPDFSLLYEHSEKYDEALEKTGDKKGVWEKKIIKDQQHVMITAAATAVGINMTFFMPFVLLRRRWSREHRGLAKFDLWTALLIPYLVATSCVVIASASQFHGKYDKNLLHLEKDSNGTVLSFPKDNIVKGYVGNLKNRLAEISEARKFDANATQIDMAVIEEDQENFEKKLKAKKEEFKDTFAERRKTDPELASLGPMVKAINEHVPEPERTIAAMLVRRDAFNLADSLKELTGPIFSHWIFGLGVLGMALSTIIILMTINGHVVCEIMGVPHKGRPFVAGALVAGLGVLGPFIWQGNSKMWLAIPTSVFGFTLIPVAYLSFFLLMNNKKILGRERPQGIGRVIWNAAMLMALGIMGIAAVYVAWNKKWGEGGIAFGKYALIAFGILLVCGHFQRQITRLTKKVSVMDNKVRRQGGDRRRDGNREKSGRRGGQQHGRGGRSGNRGRGNKGKPDSGPGDTSSE